MDNEYLTIACYPTPSESSKDFLATIFIKSLIMRTRDALASFAAVNATVNNTKGPESPFTAENGRYIKAVMEDWKVPALSIAVIDGNKIFKQVFP